MQIEVPQQIMVLEMFNKFQQENQSLIALNIENTKPEHVM